VKVLVVEDDEAIADALVSLLEDAGHPARHVPDGRRALEELRSNGDTCVILLDMTMPVMNGWRFREEQMKDASLARIPVIVCTADALAEQRALEIGAAGWLRKPLDPGRLLEAVGRFCRPDAVRPFVGPG
jgi:CheY-like chemotaxis protein